MVKRVYDTRRIERMSETDLFEMLCLYFGEPDRWQRYGLRDAAHQIARRELSWSEVQQAIDHGWNPKIERISDYLARSLAEESEVTS